MFDSKGLKQIVKNFHFSLDVGKRARESETFMETTPSKRVKKQGKEMSSSARGRASTKESWVVEDDKEAFVCGKCAEIIGSVEVEGECGATLVVCPTPILRQWQDEISRFISPLFSAFFFSMQSFLFSRWLVWTHYQMVKC